MDKTYLTSIQNKSVLNVPLNVHPLVNITSFGFRLLVDLVLVAFFKLRHQVIHVQQKKQLLSIVLQYYKERRWACLIQQPDLGSTICTANTKYSPFLYSCRAGSAVAVSRHRDNISEILEPICAAGFRI